MKSITCQERGCYMFESGPEREACEQRCRIAEPHPISSNPSFATLAVLAAASGLTIRISDSGSTTGEITIPILEGAALQLVHRHRPRLDGDKGKRQRQTAARKKQRKK